jgi:uncharacterized protein
MMKQHAYPEAYIDYLVQFHGTRDWFECHEIMEEHWKKDTGGTFRTAWLALIQIAVALYHERRGNRAGAVKMLDSAIAKCETVRWTALGVDGEALLVELRARGREWGRAETVGAFRDLDLPIIDQALLKQCEIECARIGVSWGQPSDLEDAGLIHRHTLRDRTGVIEERQKQYKWRRESTRD